MAIMQRMIRESWGGNELKLQSSVPINTDPSFNTTMIGKYNSDNDSSISLEINKRFPRENSPVNLPIWKRDEKAWRKNKIIEEEKKEEKSSKTLLDYYQPAIKKDE